MSKWQNEACMISTSSKSRKTEESVFPLHIEDVYENFAHIANEVYSSRPKGVDLVSAIDFSPTCQQAFDMIQSEVIRKHFSSNNYAVACAAFSYLARLSNEKNHHATKPSPEWHPTPRSHAPGRTTVQRVAPLYPNMFPMDSPLSFSYSTDETNEPFPAAPTLQPAPQEYLEHSSPSIRRQRNKPRSDMLVSPDTPSLSGGHEAHIPLRTENLSSIPREDVWRFHEYFNESFIQSAGGPGLENPDVLEVWTSLNGNERIKPLYTLWKKGLDPNPLSEEEAYHFVAVKADLTRCLHSAHLTFQRRRTLPRPVSPGPVAPPESIASPMNPLLERRPSLRQPTYMSPSLLTPLLPCELQHLEDTPMSSFTTPNSRGNDSFQIHRSRQQSISSVTTSKDPNVVYLPTPPVGVSYANNILKVGRRAPQIDYVPSKSSNLAARRLRLQKSTGDIRGEICSPRSAPNGEVVRYYNDYMTIGNQERIIPYLPEDMSPAESVFMQHRPSGR